MRPAADAMVIWWAHAETRGIGIPEKYLPDVVAYAKSMGMSRLRFCSTLEFWLKRAPELGWKLRNIVFEMDV